MVDNVGEFTVAQSYFGKAASGPEIAAEFVLNAAKGPFGKYRFSGLEKRFADSGERFAGDPLIAQCQPKGRYGTLRDSAVGAGDCVRANAASGQGRRRDYSYGL